MAAANSTPIQLYYSNTSGNQPLAATLIPGELAINIKDGKLFFLDGNNSVNLIATRAATMGEFPEVRFTNDSTIQVTAAAPYAYSNASFLKANAAYASQNTTGVYANSAFAQANTGIANAGGASLYANGAFVQANAAFISANNNAQSITALQGVDLTQNTNITNTLTFAGYAFDKANTNAGSIVNLQGVDAKQNTDIAYANTHAEAAYAFANTLSFGDAYDSFARASAAAGQLQANSAYAKANAAVANTSSIMLAGSLTVPGQANVNQRLAVGTGSYQILPNLIAQFTGTSDYYSQVNQQNLSGKGTSDFVLTADNGTDNINYADFGMAGSIYDNTTPNAFSFVKPNDGYMMIVGDPAQNYGGNVYFGTTGSATYADIVFIQGSGYTEVARFKNGDKLEVYRPLVANSFTTKDGVNVITYTNTANTYLQGLISNKVSKSGDTITGVLTISNTASANALVVTGNVVISQDLRVSGNLYLGGNATSITSNNLTLSDSLIYLADGNPSDVIDIGFVGAYNDGVYKHTGLARDHSDGKWKLFNSVTDEPTTTINFGQATYGNLKVGGLESNTAIIKGVNLFDYANTIHTHANAAFIRANSVVQSVTVVSSGRLTQSATTGNLTIDLATSGVIGGTYSYPEISVDSYGRVTSIGNQTPVTTFNTRSGAVTLSSSDVTTALTFTPENATSAAANLALIAGINASQNTDISGALDAGLTGQAIALGAFGTANSAASYANSGFTAANSAGSYANASFVTANAAYTLSTVGISHALAAGTYANASFLKANSAYSSQNVTGTYANNAYDQANSAASYANSSFVKANSAYFSQNTTGTYANSAFDKANAAYILAQGAYDTANAGVTAAFAYIQANASFLKANSAYESQNVTGTYANSAYTQANTATSNAAGASLYANGAFIQANAAYNSQNTTGVYANAAYTQANAGTVLAQAAFAFANNIAIGSNFLTTLAYKVDSFVGNGTTTSFVLADAPVGANNISINYNGATVLKSDFTLVNKTVTFSSPPANNAKIEITTAVPLVNESYFSNSTISIQFANDNSNSAYIHANAAYTQANSTIGAAAGPSLYANGAFIQANAAYTQANTATTNALAGSSYANSAFAKANTAANDGAGASLYANGAFVQANAAYSSQNTTGTYANSAFTQANTGVTNSAIADSKAVTAGSYANSSFAVANSASLYANGAFIKANSAYAAVNAITTSIQSANVVASSVYTGNLFVTGWTTLTETTELLTTKTGGTGTVVHDLNDGTIFYHSSIAANMTANFTNVPTTNERTTSVALILEQGASPFHASVVQIDGTPQTIKWLNNQTPTLYPNKTQIETFTLIRVGNAWVVTGQMATYG